MLLCPIKLLNWIDYFVLKHASETSNVNTLKVLFFKDLFLMQC